MKNQFVIDIKKHFKLNNMKKVMIAAMALLFISVNSFAQAVPATKTPAPSTMTVVKKEVKKKEAAKVVPIAKATPVTVSAPKTAVAPKATTATTPGLKKDGTPDKRFKNATTTAAAGPVKKDGTPDLRYKANKKK
jgi:hypothetical protein